MVKQNTLACVFFPLTSMKTKWKAVTANICRYLIKGRRLSKILITTNDILPLNKLRREQSLGLFELTSTFPKKTALPRSHWYNNITTSDLQPIRGGAQPSATDVSHSLIRGKTGRFACYFLSPTGSSDIRTMSEPTKQDISAIFKRLRAIPTNKVRGFSLDGGAFGVFAQEACQSKRSDTSHPVGNPGLAFHLNAPKSLCRVSLKVASFWRMQS